MFLGMNPWLGVFFALYVSLVHIAIMNILTFVFVNCALELSQFDREAMTKMEIERRQADIKRLNSIFKRVDVANTGRITCGQFLEFWQQDDVRVLFSVLDLEVSDVIKFFESLDVDDAEYLELEDFVMGCMRLRGGAKNLDMDTVLRENKFIMENIDRAMSRLETQLASLPPLIDESLLRVAELNSAMKQSGSCADEISL